MPDEEYAEFWDSGEMKILHLLGQQDTLSDVSVGASLAPSLVKTYNSGVW